MIRALTAIFRRDVAIAWSAGGGAAAPLGFFVGAVMLAPLALGGENAAALLPNEANPARALLALIGPGLLWILMALAVLISLERLFQADMEDGALDQLRLSTAPLELVVLAKGAALWTALGAPLALATAPLALALQAPPAAAIAIAAQLLVGAGAFIGLGLLGAALAASVKRGGVLIAILTLPFYAPTVIFGSGAARIAATDGVVFSDATALLAGCALIGAALGPIGAAAALRLHED